MYQIEKIELGYKEEAELVLADNGIAFPVKQLQVSTKGDYYHNRTSRVRFKVVGSCQVDIDAICKGGHYLLEDDFGKVWLLIAEGFEKNFVRV